MYGTTSVIAAAPAISTIAAPRTYATAAYGAPTYATAAYAAPTYATSAYAAPVISTAPVVTTGNYGGFVETIGGVYETGVVNQQSYAGQVVTAPGMAIRCAGVGAPATYSQLAAQRDAQYAAAVSQQRAMAAPGVVEYVQGGVGYGGYGGYEVVEQFVGGPTYIEQMVAPTTYVEQLVAPTTFVEQVVAPTYIEQMVAPTTFAYAAPTIIA